MKKINSALISVFSKEGLDKIVQELDSKGVQIYSTGGTQAYIEQLGVKVNAVETLTSYPSILDGRVKTLHPKVFGGLLARREEAHLAELKAYDIPEIDLVIVDLYPFEDTVAQTNDEQTIIEKIDIGGISLIRAAAKNYKDVLVVPSKAEYPALLELLKEKQCFTELTDRKWFATKAFGVSSHYDVAIYNYFNKDSKDDSFKASIGQSTSLRYGENPHQKGTYYGDFDKIFHKLSGKALSYNNLVDVDAAVNLMSEFNGEGPTFAVLKHTNTCGLATRATVLEAWHAALAGDNISAFGGILICNEAIGIDTAKAIDAIFYEVLIAPDFSEDAIQHLSKKKKRILLQLKAYPKPAFQYKSLLNGAIVQEFDRAIESEDDMKLATTKAPSTDQMRDLIFANKCVKHLKSNTIVMVRGQQLLGMACGQTSRVDACKQAIEKAGRFGFDLKGAVMASDAFFPFPDCVEIAHLAGIEAVIQPGGSIKDEESVNYCNANGLAMVLTGIRHFKH